MSLNKGKSSTFQLLHISDLHVRVESGEKFDRSVVLDSLIDRVKLDCKKNGLEPEIVIVSGDIAYSGKKEEYTEAKKFFDDLLNALKLPAERLFLVPGNHDVDRKKYRPRDIPQYDDMKELNLELEDEGYRADLFKGMDEYFNFVNNQYPHLRSTHGKLVPFVKTHHAECGKKIGLIGLNSAWMCRKSPDKGEIAIGEYQIKNAMEEVADQGSHDLVIAVFHHPLYWLWDEDRKISRPWFNDKMLLCGHFHDTDAVYSWDLQGKYHQIIAGSIYMGSDTKLPHQYHYQTVDWVDGQICLDLRKTGTDNRTWIIDTENNDKGRAYFPLNGQAVPAVGSLSEKPCPGHEEFEKYLESALVEHRHLPTKGFETTLRMPIELERVYINMHAHIHVQDKEHGHKHICEQHKDEDGDREHSSLDISGAFALAERYKVKDMVILGRPGSGKTTLLKYILIMLIQGKGLEKLGLSNAFIPFFAPLRKLTDPENEGFLDFIYRTSELKEFGLTPETLQTVFDNNCGLVLLDGLDEVADEKLRIRACKWIDKARKKMFPNTRFVVTSRFAGYLEKSRLDGNVLELSVQDFTISEVKDFLVRWFETVESGLHADEDEERWRKKGREEGKRLADIIGKSDHIKKLAVNPLLLQIIALVHRDRGHIPERRVDLYEECTNVLLEKWDMAKGLDVLLTAKESRNILQPVALWLHEKDGRKAAPLAQIQEVIKEPLDAMRKSEIDTEKLLANIRDRSGIFMGHGGDEYGFAHLSFQEYLSAEEIRNQNRIQFLVDKYGDRWWREVTLLCLSLDNPSVIEPFMEYLIHKKKFEDEISLAIDAINDSIKKPTKLLIAALANNELSPKIRSNIARLIETIGGDTAENALNIYRGVNIGHANIKLFSIKATGRGARVEGSGMKGLPEKITIPKDGSEMVLIPAGTFLFGSREDDEMADSDEKPQRVIELPDYYMDVYQVTNNQYCGFLNDVKPVKADLEKWIYFAGSFQKEKCRISQDKGHFSVENGYGKHPVIYVTWYGAEAYAKWAGKRLPTEQEWEKAARGTDGLIWPWGNEFDEDLCNSIEGGPGHTTPVGRFTKGVSPHGCYDMAGNVWEWTDSWYDDDKDTKKVLRGGSWYVNHDVSRCAYRSRVIPEAGSSGFGFRCARIKK